MIFATNNDGKLKQLKHMANGLEILGLKEAGIDVEVEEDGLTLEDNATKKAMAIYNITKKSVVSDDSGLFIDYYDGWPGVYTHRFIPSSTAKQRNDAILDRMQNVDDDLRGAKVVCVLSVVDKHGKVFLFRGELDCKIAKNQRGDNFFGFDSIVELPNGKTLAELSDQEKEKINARSIAFDLLAKAYKNGDLDVE